MIEQSEAMMLKASLTAYYEWAAQHPEAEVGQVPARFMAARFMAALDGLAAGASQAMQLALNYMAEGDLNRASAVLHLGIAQFAETTPKGVTIQ